MWKSDGISKLPLWMHILHAHLGGTKRLATLIEQTASFQKYQTTEKLAGAKPSAAL